MRPSQNLPLPPYQNIPPLFNNYMQHSQNLPLHPRIYPPPFFLTTICDPFRIYPYLSYYTSPPPPCQQLHICDQPKIYPSLQEKNLLSLEIISFCMLFFLFSSSEPPLTVHTHVTRTPILKSLVTGLIKEYDKTNDTFL